MTDPRPTQTAASPLSEERVREYEQMLAAVTPGQWRPQTHFNAMRQVADCGPMPDGFIATVHAMEAKPSHAAANARFIAASPTMAREFIAGYRALLSDRAALTARLEAVERENAELREAKR